MSIRAEVGSRDCRTDALLHGHRFDLRRIRVERLNLDHEAGVGQHGARRSSAAVVRVAQSQDFSLFKRWGCPGWRGRAPRGRFQARQRLGGST